jgi:hypothetical protein
LEDYPILCPVIDQNQNLFSSLSSVKKCNTKPQSSRLEAYHKKPIKSKKRGQKKVKLIKKNQPSTLDNDVPAHLAEQIKKKKIAMHNAIRYSMRNAVKCLHRTKDSTNDRMHQMPVCLVCDRFIIGADCVHQMSAKTVKKHTNVLSSQSLEEFQNSPIHTELKRQYSVRGLPGLLLSPRARKGRLGYSTCSDCFYDLKYKKPKNTKPPKLSIANGFVIGAFPNKIKIASGPNKGMMRNIDVENEDQVSEIMRALVSPVRPYGYVIAYTGGKHQSIKGHYQFFEMNTEKINAGMHALSRNQCNVSVMLCGPMTTSQRTKIHRRAQIDSQKYVDIMTWLINNSSKPSIQRIPLPTRCTVPNIYDDSSPTSKEKKSKKKERLEENSFGGGTYYFSSAHTPTPSTSVYESTSKFAEAILKNKSPQLFVYGGNRTDPHKADLEDIMPLTFPFGTGGPRTKRRVNVSLEECIKRYMMTAMPQFMRSDVIFILQHIYSRQLSYKTGVIKLKNKIGGQQAGDIIGNATKDDFIRAVKHRTNNPTDPLVALSKTVKTTCQSLGYTEEASKLARMNSFAMVDHFGLNSLFLTTTPCDECSFRVRLFTNPNGLVSHLVLIFQLNIL